MNPLPKSPRIVLAGSVISTRRTLQKLLQHNLDVVGVLGLDVQASKNVSGYARVDDLLADTDIPYVDFTNINDSDIVAQVRAWQPDLLFVVGLSQLIKQPLMSLPQVGCVGFHPTLLPKGRGRAPIAWLILDAEEAGAATFFLIDDGVDAGPILAQRSFQITSSDYASDVVQKLEVAIDAALDSWLPILKDGQWKPVSQNASEATYRGKRTRADGLIDWSQSARTIYALIRAASRPHPGAYTYVKGRRLLIWKAELVEKPIKGGIGRILENSGEKIVVQTGEGLLALTEIEFDPPVERDLDSRLLRIGVRFGYASGDEIWRLKTKVGQMEARISNLEGIISQNAKS